MIKKLYGMIILTIIMVLSTFAGVFTLALANDGTANTASITAVRHETYLYVDFDTVLDEGSITDGTLASYITINGAASGAGGVSFNPNNNTNGYFLWGVPISGITTVEFKEGMPIGVKDGSTYYLKETQFFVLNGTTYEEVTSQNSTTVTQIGVSSGNLYIENIFDKDKKDVALKSMMKYNFKEKMRNVLNMWRVFSVNDESGTVICSYPEHKEKPIIPISYCEETMTGFEYAFAGLLAAEGFLEESEKVVSAIRDRYDGEKRNPWNEIECGNNYARSMASFSLLLIHSGFDFNVPHKHIGFYPIKKYKSRYLWSVDNSWGEVVFSKNKCVFKVFGAPIQLASFGVTDAQKCKRVAVDGKSVVFSIDEDKIKFSNRKINDNISVYFDN